MSETSEASAVQLRSEYESLCQAAQGFDLQTRKLEKTWADEIVQRKKDRAAERAQLMQRKQTVSIAMRDAEAREAERAAAQHAADVQAEAEKIAAEGLSEGTPIVATEQTTAGVGDGVQIPNEGQPIEPIQQAPADEPPVTPGMYHGVSNVIIGDLIKSNEEQIKTAFPDVKPPESRKDAIDLLVKAGIRPTKRR